MSKNNKRMRAAQQPSGPQPLTGEEALQTIGELYKYTRTHQGRPGEDLAAIHEQLKGLAIRLQQCIRECHPDFVEKGQPCERPQPSPGS
jgi:hypothetical protein